MREEVKQMPKGSRFGRNSGDRCSMTRSERAESKSETARIHAQNASTPENRRMHQAEADACERMAKTRREMNQ